MIFKPFEIAKTPNLQSNIADERSEDSLACVLPLLVLIAESHHSQAQAAFGCVPLSLGGYGTMNSPVPDGLAGKPEKAIRFVAVPILPRLRRGYGDCRSGELHRGRHHTPMFVIRPIEAMN